MREKSSNPGKFQCPPNDLVRMAGREVGMNSKRAAARSLGVSTSVHDSPVTSSALIRYAAMLVSMPRTIS